MSRRCRSGSRLGAGNGRRRRGAGRCAAHGIDARVGVGVWVDRKSAVGAHHPEREAVALPFGDTGGHHGLDHLPVCARAGHEELGADGAGGYRHAQRDRLVEHQIVGGELVSAADGRVLGRRRRRTGRVAGDADRRRLGQRARWDDHLHAVGAVHGAALRADQRRDGRRRRCFLVRVRHCRRRRPGPRPGPHRKPNGSSRSTCSPPLRPNGRSEEVVDSAAL